MSALAASTGSLNNTCTVFEFRFPTLLNPGGVRSGRTVRTASVLVSGPKLLLITQKNLDPPSFVRACAIAKLSPIPPGTLAPSRHH